MIRGRITLPPFLSSKEYKRVISFPPFFANSFLLVMLTAVVIGLVYYAKQCFASTDSHVDINLDWHHLPKYAFFSLCRACIAYLLSFLFSITIGYIAAKDRVAEKIIIPCLDILQSIPVLGFMPAFFLLFISIFPSNNLGLELTSILMIFTGQTWNMAFSVYHSIRTIPKEKLECATLYQLGRWRQFTALDLPSSSIALVWNSMMAVAGGWFFLMTSEAFSLKDRSFKLPGLGSYMSQAAAAGDISSMLWAVAFMILLIVLLDQFIWRPLTSWVQKFRLEETSSSTITSSWFQQLLQKSFLRRWHLPRFSFHCKRSSPPLFSSLVHTGLCVICLLIAFGFYAVTQQLAHVTATTWKHLSLLTFFTFLRVLGCLCISTLLALPIGLAIGLSKKASLYLQPFIQIGASFPATLLFPAMIWIFHQMHIPMDISTIILMLMGTGWYVLFTTLAGISAIPHEYREAATVFKLRPMQKIFRFYLPAIAPYLITGMISAAGGAWNASIVSEYISYKGQTFTVQGIGSSINLAAQNNDPILLISSIVCLASFVAIINYFFWLRMYHYSEKRFSLNT